MIQAIVRTSLALWLLAALSSSALGADGTLRVVTTIPDLADIVAEVGGDRVEVTSIAKGRENIHAVQTKPSHIIALSKADLFFEIGLSLEHAWVPGLLRTARNKRIEPGAPGFVNVSEGWETIEVPESLSREQGADLHPEGNPHINLDPRAGRHIAGRVLEALRQAAPDDAAGFEARHADYLERLDAAEARWARVAERLRELTPPAVVYHTEFNYLLRTLGIELVGTLEPKPGIAPTPRHLAQVVLTMREREVRALFTAAWSNNNQVRDVAHKTGAGVFELPTMVGGSRTADTWIGLMDTLHGTIARAFGVDAGDQ